MSGKVTVLTLKLGTCSGRPHWIVGWRPTSNVNANRQF